MSSATVEIPLVPRLVEEAADGRLVALGHGVRAWYAAGASGDATRARAPIVRLRSGGTAGVGVGARFPPACRHAQSREVVVPTDAVAVDRLRREAAVDEPKQRARTVPDQVDLDRARARGDELLVALPAPGEDDAPPRAGLEVLAARHVLEADLAAEDATRARVELSDPSDDLR